MLLTAMVPDSKYRELIEKIPPSELKGITVLDGLWDNPPFPIVTADASLDKLLEIAADVQATPGQSQSLTRWDRLLVTGYDKVGEDTSDGVTGDVCFWSSELVEDL